VGAKRVEEEKRRGKKKIPAILFNILVAFTYNVHISLILLN
jgi:hypothetical protein